MSLPKYLLARVNKMGSLTTQGIIDTIVDSPTIRKTRYEYTITNAREVGEGARRGFVATLTKFLNEGEVRVVDPEEHVVRPTEVPNLEIGSCPFVYLPGDEVVAYEEDSGEIASTSFATTFAQLVVKRHFDFFVACSLEPIVNFAIFFSHVARVSAIREIDVQVHPSNPLFGPAWEDLQAYLKKRRAEEMRIKEKTKATPGLDSNLKELAEIVEAYTDEEERRLAIAEWLKKKKMSIADAAVLMAADGYGHALLRAVIGRRTTVITTQKSQASVEMTELATPEQLIDALVTKLKEQSIERQLRHGK